MVGIQPGETRQDKVPIDGEQYILACMITHEHFKDQHAERVPVDALVVTFTLYDLGSHYNESRADHQFSCESMTLPGD